MFSLNRVIVSRGMALVALAMLAGVQARFAIGEEPKSKYPFVFSDAGQATGLLPDVGGIRGHAAAWGDVNADGWPELFVGTFHNAGSKASQLFRNEKGKFRLDAQEHVRTSGIGSGALFVDLNNSGRLDLYVSHCAHGKEGLLTVPSLLFRNEGDGKFTDISKESGACPSGYAGRGLAALDYDGDGLLDLVLCEQYYSPNVKTGPALFRNLGNYRFENVSETAGLPLGLGGLGVAAADLNLDGWPDIFLTHGGGEHRLLLNDGKGKFHEAPGSREVFRWNTGTPDDTPAGVAIADVNRDTLPDLVIGNHFKSPWTKPAPVRLYLNRGIENGTPKFEDVSEAAGLKPLEMKAPHVEIQDFDNDGWADIYVSIVKFQAGRPCPIILKNLGTTREHMPQFSNDAWAVNDFPTDEDRAIKRSGTLFEKILKEKKIIYMAAAPSADFDRDGRLDLFLANWWLESPSLLLRNETPDGHWLDVTVEGKDGVNRMGIGARVNVYATGKSGVPSALLGSREIAIGYGYCSGQEAVAHFGLGQNESVDLEVILPHGKGTIVRKDVKANQRLAVKP
ncbi:FG-GAP repeat protein [Anatilimnocola aggregata]|uniref:FG-GAP repeat protein n=1 Tax=Anatilimnocola aggregata TaxID=2528021 RepID=A0A517Y5K0_9BACT|nr:CRTAC1 family protein [Anatilimnocola aggregata]QDU25519.1 FG-GAP repeat protein [Anatilimnocola aggregata]